MIKEFRKYDKQSYKVAVVPIQALNDICKSYDVPVEFIYKYDEPSEHCIMSIINNTNVPPQVLVGACLGVSILDWRWSDNGLSVVISYKITKE